MVKIVESTEHKSLLHRVLEGSSILGYIELCQKPSLSREMLV